jgi:uncharacterized protein (TIGR03067 family)
MFAVAVLMLVPTAAPDAKELSADAKKEVKKLEGKWKAVKVLVGGREENPGPDEADAIVEVKGTKFLVKGKEVLEITAVDPTTTPKCIDFKALIDEGELAKGSVIEGIYKLDGDNLVLAIYFEGGKQRPDKFESPENSKVIVVTLERVKK